MSQMKRLMEKVAIEQIRQRVQDLPKGENTVPLEWGIYKDVLEAIALGHPNPRSLALTALDLPGWS